MLMHSYSLLGNTSVLNEPATDDQKHHLPNRPRMDDRTLRKWRTGTLIISQAPVNDFKYRYLRRHGL